MKKFFIFLICIILISCIILTSCSQINQLIESAIVLETNETEEQNDEHEQGNATADSDLSSAMLTPLMVDTVLVESAVMYIYSINNGFRNYGLPSFNNIDEIDNDFVIGLCFYGDNDGTELFSSIDHIETTAQRFMNPDFKFSQDHDFDDLYGFLTYDESRGGYTWPATGGSAKNYEIKLMSAYKMQSGKIVVNTTEYLLEGDAEYMWTYADIIVDGEIVGDVKYYNDMLEKDYTYYIDESELPMYTYVLTPTENGMFYIESKVKYGE